MSSPLSFRVFNSFTTTPFTGNPGAVYVFSADDPRSSDADLMLSIAKEHNLSETGFVGPRPSSVSAVPTYGLRWFTPTVEFPLCGHVTLGSAHVLFEEHHPDATRLQFETLSGTLFASRLADGRIELDFPADVSVVEDIEVELEEDVLDKLVHVNAALAAAVVRVRKGKIGWVIELKEDFDLETAVLTVAPLVRYSTSLSFSFYPTDLYSLLAASLRGLLHVHSTRWQAASRLRHLHPRLRPS
jgi:PhzF family phenazine biosynthesis protein